MTHIAENIASLRAQIRSYEREFQRPEGSVELLAVSKRHDVDSIRQAHAAGLTQFGENYLQEAQAKIAALSDLDLTWHFIGPIQTNKTRGIAEDFDWVQSVDREKIARRLSEQRPADKPPLNVCIQFNVSDEPSKSGVSAMELDALCELVTVLPGLKLRGLMTIPAISPDFDEQRATFHKIARHFQRLKDHYPDLDTLSMGMSGDFGAAIAEGATLVRIGTGIFGLRT